MATTILLQPVTQPPSLDGFDAKMTRARTHHQALKDINRQINEDELYQFRGEVLDDGLVHRYRVQQPPAPDPQWSAVIGDCLHNLRAALDYLATQLVLISGNDATDHTQFPVRTKSKASQVTIDGGLREDIRQAVECVQPYLGTPLGQQLGRLHQLDIIDKHRQLLVAATAPRAFGVNFNPSQHPVSSLNREYRPLREITIEHDEPIFEILFREPVHRLTPTRPITLISFSTAETEAAGRDADKVLEELAESLDEVRARFAPFF